MNASQTLECILPLIQKVRAGDRRVGLDMVIQQIETYLSSVNCYACRGEGRILFFDHQDVEIQFKQCGPCKGTGRVPKDSAKEGPR